MSDETALTVEAQTVVWLAQAPEFGERLSALKAEWEARAAEAEALEVSDGSLQAAKKSRAALRKDFDEIEAQRKDALAPVRERIDAFQAVYKECVTDAFNRADAALKGKISAIEDGLKAECETRLRGYWQELCAVRNIDFIPFERTGVSVDLASARQKTPKKLMERLTAFAERVSGEVNVIMNQSDAAEIMDEYKQSLNMALAMDTVLMRHARIEAERVEAERRREAEAAAAEAVVKVNAAVPEALAPPAPAAPVAESAFPPAFAFTIYFDTAAQWEAVKPLLVGLKNALKENNVRYE